MTTIYISLAVGAQVPPYPASVAFRSPHRFVSGTTVVLPEPAPVALGRDGTGVVTVDPGVWLVDEILPTQTIRRAVIVPDSPGTVSYSSLVEVTDPADIGFGPTWASAVLAAAAAAAASAAEAAASVSGLEDVVLGVLDFDEVPPAPGIYLRRPESSGGGSTGSTPTVLLGTPLSAMNQSQTGDLIITPHASTVPGDRVIVACSVADSAAANYSIAGGSGAWTTLLSSSSLGTGKFFIFSKIFAAGDTTYTLSRTGSDAYRIVPITAAGSATTAPPIVGALGTRAGSGGGFTTTAPSIDTTTANTLVLMIAQERTLADDGDVTVNNGFTVRHDAHTIDGDNLQALFVASKALAVPGPVGATTATFTNSNATNSGALLIAIPPRPAP